MKLGLDSSKRCWTQKCQPIQREKKSSFLLVKYLSVSLVWYPSGGLKLCYHQITAKSQQLKIDKVYLSPMCPARVCWELCPASCLCQVLGTTCNIAGHCVRGQRLVSVIYRFWLRVIPVIVYSKSHNRVPRRWEELETFCEWPCWLSRVSIKFSSVNFWRGKRKNVNFWACMLPV